MTNGYLTDGEIIMMELEEEDRKEAEKLNYYLDRKESFERDMMASKLQCISLLTDSMNNMATALKEMCRPSTTINIFISSDADIKAIQSTINGIEQVLIK